MGVIEEVNKLHITLKSIIFALALVMPFWYFDIYLIKLDFFNTAPIQIPIIASFCISLIWVACHFFSASGFMYIYKETNTDNSSRKRKIENTLIWCVINSTVWIALFSVLAFFYNWDFITLLKVSFLIWGYRIGIIYFWTYSIDRKAKKMAEAKANQIQNQLNEALK